MLLTGPERLDPSVAGELWRLGVGAVVFVGPVHVERREPYELAGTAGDGPGAPARPFDTTELNDDPHTLSVSAPHRAGAALVLLDGAGRGGDPDVGRWLFAHATEIASARIIGGESAFSATAASRLSLRTAG